MVISKINSYILKPSFIESSKRAPHSSKPKQQMMGLTLIEVLIALAIVSIAMTAIIKTVTQNIRSTQYLQNKTIAMYVGQQVLNEARVGLYRFANDNNIQQTEMLGNRWFWQAEEVATPNEHIKKIKIKVFAHENNAEENPVISMESYLYRE